MALVGMESVKKSPYSNVRFCLAEFKGCPGRKANVQADRPTLPQGEIPPLFRKTRSNEVEPYRRTHDMIWLLIKEGP
jgi:hypothetical protein